jgi:hypothetical protein
VRGLLAGQIAATSDGGFVIGRGICRMAPRWGCLIATPKRGGDGPLPLMRCQHWGTWAQRPRHIPLGRAARPESFLGPAPLLASELSAYVTGSVIGRRLWRERGGPPAMAATLASATPGVPSLDVSSQEAVDNGQDPMAGVRKAARAPPRRLGLRPPSGQRAGGAGRMAKAAAGQMGLQAAACPAQS